jgi:DNA modification methylase
MNMINSYIMGSKYQESDQTKLFEFIDEQEDQLAKGLQSLDRLIPTSQTRSYTHAIHPYVAKFMPHFPNLFIRLLTKPGDIVLDPMCGSGTTLIDAMLNGRNAFGIDIDPLPRLITKVATTRVSKSKLEKLKQWEKEIEKININPKDHDLKVVFNHHIWFRDDVLATILHIKSSIVNLNDTDLQDIAKLSLSRIIKEVSNADPRDLMPEINHEKPINNDADVFKSFSKSLEKTIEKISAFTERVKEYPDVNAKIVGNDARKITLKENCVDLIVTSPPYAYAMDYARIHKLSLFTSLGISNDEVRGLSKEYVGTDRISVKDSFEFLPELEFLQEFVDKLAAQNKKRSMSLQKYLMDMYSITKECARVLKPGGHFVYVIGNSTLAKSHFSTSEALQKMGKLSGLDLILTHSRPYFVRSMGHKRADHSAVTKSDIFILFRKRK